MIGKIVGNYRIVEKIGEGGMGAVYRAADLMLERDVALKAIRPELSREPQIVERFRTEARTLARVNHPAIANVYTFFYEEDELFLVMELVRGRTLSRVLQAEGAIPWQRAVLFLSTAMEGIEQAHRLGIVHRDLKPDNLILSENGMVKVMDFGIARVMGSGHLTRTGLLVGTLRYMSPEQIRGEEVDGRTDVYALGAVLYEMLTGRTPFEGSSDWAILRAQMEDTPRPPGEQVPSIPWWLDRAVLRALAKHPSERFQSVAEMRRSLLRQGETVEGPHPAGAAIEDLPTVVTPVGARQTPAPVAPPPPTPAHTTIASSIPPVPIVPPPPPANAPPTPTSYRPVELGRQGSTGRRALALAAFLGVALIGLLALNRFLTPDAAPPPAGSAETRTPAQEIVSADVSTAPSEPPAAAPSIQPAAPINTTSPAPRPSPPPPRPAPSRPEPLPAAATTEEAAPPQTEEPAPATYAPEEPAPSAPQGPIEEIHRLAGEIETRSAELVDLYSDFLGNKEDSGAELTDNDQKLKDELDELQEAAEKLSGQLKVGFFGRLRGRKPDDRRRIGQNFRELARLGGEVDRLMTDVQPTPEVRQSWQAIRHRWQRMAEIVRSF